MTESNITNKLKTIRLIIISAVLLLTLGCTKKPLELSYACKKIIESDTFYYVIPTAEMQPYFDSMLRLDNFLTVSQSAEVQTIDFDCVVSVSPTNEKLEELKKIEQEYFDETVRITAIHIEATRCVTESNDIKFVDAAGQLIRFKTESQTWNLDMQKNVFLDWKFILFKKGKKPKIIPNVRMTFDQIEEYFGIKSKVRP